MVVLKAKANQASSGFSQFLQIAATTIAIAHDPSFTLRNQDTLYCSFFSAHPQKRNASLLQVRLVHGQMPDLSRLHKLFDTRESWSIYSDRKGYWIRFQSACQPDPFWIARFDRQASWAIVYCGSPLPSRRGGGNDLANPICYPLDQILLMYHLAFREGVLAHAAGVELDGRGLIFLGASGAGKSTLSRLFADSRLGKLLSDERTALRLDGTCWQAYGTPWAGTEGIAGNGHAPLARIFFLKQDKKNHMRELNEKEALERLLPVLSIPWYDHEVMSLIIALAKNLVGQVPAYEMSFMPDRSAVDFFQEFQKKFSRAN
jgi:hypothetical protein